MSSCDIFKSFKNLFGVKGSVLKHTSYLQAGKFCSMYSVLPVFMI